MASSGGTDEAILSANSLPITKFNLYVSSVCYLVLQKDGGNIKKKASGFLAHFLMNGSKKIVVVMNHHFISTIEEARDVIATFKFDGQSDYKIVALDPEIFFRTDKELDYTFVGISQQYVDQLRDNHVNPVSLNPLTIFMEANDVVHIPQHPEGRQLNLSSSTICSITQSEVFYKADTTFGSSGSPVLCIQGNEMFVLALHKSGGVQLLDGRLANRGILISAILAHICPSSAANVAGQSNIAPSFSNGNRESGAYVRASTANPVVQSPSVVTTNHGLPVAHPQSAQDVSNSNSTSRFEPTSTSDLPQEIENPVPQAPQSPVPLVQSPPNQQDRARDQDICQRPFESKELMRIAQRIGPDWREVAKLTNTFRSWELDNIEHSHPLDKATLKADRMLTDYKSRLGKRETLFKAISESGKLELAKKVREGFYLDNYD